MKVFVNFGDIRCVVPVGDGSLSVSNVIQLAIERYRKATSQSKTINNNNDNNHREIIVHTLKTIKDGAILDPDDRIFDVVDDREQLIAIFDEHPCPSSTTNYYHHHQQQQQIPQNNINKNDNQQESIEAKRLTCQNKQPVIVDDVDDDEINLINEIASSNSRQSFGSSSSSASSSSSSSSTSYSSSRKIFMISKPQQRSSSMNNQISSNIRKVERIDSMNQSNDCRSNKPPLPPQHGHSHVLSGSFLTNEQISNKQQQQQKHSINEIRTKSSNFDHQQTLNNHLSYHSRSISESNSDYLRSKTTSKMMTNEYNNFAKKVTKSKDNCLDEAVVMATDDDTTTGSNLSTSDDQLDMEIIVDDSSISRYSSTLTATAQATAQTTPMLHVRHGSEPYLNQLMMDLDNVEDAGNDDPDDHMPEIKVNLSKSMSFNKSMQQKRWSTAIAFGGHKTSAAIITSSLSSTETRNIAKQSLNQMISNHDHHQSDEENQSSFNHSISPQSTKEEGYASEELQSSNSHQSDSHHTTIIDNNNHHDSSFNDLNSSTMFSQNTNNNSKNNHSPQRSNFARGSGRLSMLAQNMDQWADAADRQLMKLHSESNQSDDNNQNQHDKQSSLLQVPSQQLCDSSLGSMVSNSSHENDPMQNINNNNNNKYRANRMTVIIDLTKQSGPLGIHVLPDSNDGTRLKRGLEIQSIEPGSRIDRDGRLNAGDIIIEIDGHPFGGLEFERAQELFRSALSVNSQIELSIIKSEVFCDNSKNEQLLHQRFVSNKNNQDDDQDGSRQCDVETKSDSLLVEGEERFGPVTKLAAVTPTKKHSPQSVAPLIGYKPAASAIVIANTRRIGKKYHIQLKKGEHGLGFTITTRDNPTGGLSPIYIKTILPRGAAVQDGRLKPGDRLLEVCGIEITGKSQEEAVRIMRNIPTDSIVDLIVSRQEVEVSPSPLMPRQLPPEAANEPNCSSTKIEREVMTFQIPLNDTGSAGLGISVKGKTLTIDGRQQDSGIFIKSVLHGGAASKDGRLKQDDQLININGIPLSGKTNSEAMETLTRATIKSAHQITLTIARRICNSPSHQICSSNTDDHSSSSSAHFTRHKHESSILSNNSYDMSFCHSNQQIQSNNGADQSHTYDEDSYRSSAENTVICGKKSSETTELPFNAEISNQNQSSIIEPQQSLNDSQSSLNDSTSGDQSITTTAAAERFRRDGFGRQSMSEKRHAQLDAKATDTYRRSKKTKEHPQIVIDCNNASQNGSIEPDDQTIDKENIADIDCTPKSNINKKSNATKTPIFFSPVCCWKCQSPGSCPCRSRSEISPMDIYRMNGSNSLQNTRVLSEHQQQQQRQMLKNSDNNGVINVVAGSGMRKSCSLESLQLMMQDLQKEQLQEHVGKNVVVTSPQTIGYIGHTTPHYPNHYHQRQGSHQMTTGTRSGKNYPSESFRAAVDRSFEIKNYLNVVNSNNIHAVSEENDPEDSISRPSLCPYRVGGGHSMTSTNFTTETGLTMQTTTTTTTANDDQANLLKSSTLSAKKKKGSIFKNLFHFGSRKGRSKSVDPGVKNSSKNNSNNNQHTNSSESTATTNEEMKIFSPDYRLKYRQEQERINAQYRKLLEEQQKQQRQLIQQQQSRHGGFVRNQSHPMHQSMPLSSSHRSKSSTSPRNQQQQQTTTRQTPPAYHIMNTVGVPHSSQNKSTDKSTNQAFMRSSHRIHPQDCSPMFNNDNSNYAKTPDNSRHIRINSQEFHGRQSMDRSTSRVIPSENYATYGMINNAQRIYGTANRLSVDPERISTQQQQHHFRQLSLRNPQHNRQISSPAAITNRNHYYSNTPQSRSNVYGYEPQQQQQQQSLSTREQRSYTMNSRPYPVNSYGGHPVSMENAYGIVGQHKRIHQPQQQQTLSSNINTPQMNSVMRQQQPIYQSNQVQIYGTIYNNQNNGQSSSTTTSASLQAQQLYAMTPKSTYVPLGGGGTGGGLPPPHPH